MLISKLLAKALLWAMYRTGQSPSFLLSEWAKGEDIDDRERLKREREKTLAQES